MYKFDNCYWIVHSYSEYDGVVQDCGIRRCNNSLKIKDPKNGAIFSIPCVVDYDMAASTVKVSKYILTPNNHAVIMVQGNEDTLRLFKTNTRFILSGRPFKLYGYQNAVDYDINSPTTLLYLDLYLDEFRDGDDLELGIAENGTYNYDIFINSQDLTLLNGATGKLTANVLLNNVEVERNVIWESANSDVVEIDTDGNYNVIGDINDSTTITAFIEGNKNVYDFITITIGNTSNIVNIVLQPDFSVIRQYESIDFNIEVYYNGELLNNEDLNISAQIESNIISIYKKNNNSYMLTSNSISDIPQRLIITASCNNPSFNKTETLEIKAVSMLG